MNTSLLNDHDLTFTMVLTVGRGKHGNRCLLHLGEILKAAVEAREQGRPERSADEIDFTIFNEAELELAEGHFVALMTAFKGRKPSVQFCSEILQGVIAAQAQRGAIGCA